MSVIKISGLAESDGNPFPVIESGAYHCQVMPGTKVMKIKEVDKLLIPLKVTEGPHAGHDLTIFFDLPSASVMLPAEYSKKVAMIREFLNNIDTPVGEGDSFPEESEIVGKEVTAVVVLSQKEGQQPMNFVNRTLPVG